MRFKRLKKLAEKLSKDYYVNLEDKQIYDNKDVYIHREVIIEIVVNELKLTDANKVHNCTDIVYFLLRKKDNNPNIKQLDNINKKMDKLSKDFIEASNNLNDRVTKLEGVNHGN